MPQYNVRFINKSSTDLRYVTVNGKALIEEGHIYQGELQIGKHRDYTGDDQLFGGPRAVIAVSTFPPEVMYAEVFDVDHDYYIIQFTDVGVTASPGDGLWGPS